MSRARLLGLLIALSSLHLGCAGVKGVCAARVVDPSGAQAREWFSLLLHSYDPQGAAGAPVDCSGVPVLWGEEAQSCEEPSRVGEPIAPAALSGSDLVVSDVGPSTKLVWVIVRRFTSGEGMGPLAWVETHGSHRVVKAIGPLRALTTRARLRLEVVGQRELVVAEGEHCPGAQGAPCERVARVLPRRGARFIAEPITDPAGTCVGPSLFHLSRVETVKLKSGWQRQFELTTSLSFSKEAIVANEQMVVNDKDPNQPTVPSRLFRRAQITRNIRVADKRLVSDERSLWSRVKESDR